MDDSSAYTAESEYLFHGKEVQPLGKAPPLSDAQRQAMRTDIRSTAEVLPWAGAPSISEARVPPLTAEQAERLRTDVRSNAPVLPMNGRGDDVKVVIPPLNAEQQRNFMNNILGFRPPVLQWNGKGPFRAFRCEAANAVDCLKGLQAHAVPKKPVLERCTFVNDPDGGFVGFVCPEQEVESP